MADIELNVDALLPPDMANRAEAVGIRKAKQDFWMMFALAILAGAFIAAGRYTRRRFGPADRRCPMG
jgi:formate/nitrite transporter FocA (FNT family)